MVFFVCEHCNETVKKNQVDKHVLKCRNCYAVTCVDCSQTFYGNDYINHIICITEAEKYEKTLYKPKINIKLNPQEVWNNLIEIATNNDNIKNAPNQIKQYLNRLKELTNVPRNKKKFINFSKNSLKLYNDLILENIWTYLDGFRSSNDDSNAGASNGKGIVGIEDVKNVVVIDNHQLSHVEPLLIDNDKDVIDEDNNRKKKKKEKKVKKEKRKVETSECNGVEDARCDGGVLNDRSNEIINNDYEDLNTKKKNKKDKKRSKRKFDEINVDLD